MRLLNVICSTNPEHGGVIEWVRQFGPIAERLGHQVEVASLDHPEDPWVQDFPLKVHALGQKYRYFYSPVTTIGIQAPEGNPDAQRQCFHEQFPETRFKRILLFLGRIHPKKGCDLLIESFGRIASEQDNLHLVMAGPDYTSWIPRLKEIARKHGIEDRITWAGMIGGEVKWGAFHAADAFVLPSHQENFGIAVVEAMACGTPVLISNQVDIYTEIQTDGAGLTADDTQEDTSRLLLEWIRLSPEQQAKMSENALACFRTRFEVTSAVKGLMEILEKNIALGSTVL